MLFAAARIGLAVAGDPLVLANASPSQARRMMGALSICIGTGPLGDLGLGAFAEVVVLGLIVARRPRLLAPQPIDLAAMAPSATPRP